MAKRTKKPYFLWDYDLTQAQVKKMLREGNDYTKQWLTARILESAKYEDIWKYLTFREVLAMFSKLRLKKPVKEAWENAFRAWGVTYENSDSHTASGKLP